MIVSRASVQTQLAVKAPRMIFAEHRYKIPD